MSNRLNLASYRLLEREEKVLKLLLDGHSNKAISEQLFLSPGTIKKYVRTICEKCGVDHQEALVLKFSGQNQDV